MKKYVPFKFLILTTVVTAFLLLRGDRAFAHCDGLDGPVVKAALKALDTSNVNLVLIWVQKKDEAEVRAAFQKAVGVRKLGPEAKELADTYFFETVVRLHRAGEGAPYTGLKRAGRDLGPAIPAADKAIEEGSAKQVQHLLTRDVQEGVAKRFEELIVKKKFDPKDVQAGREYVKAYVTFVHYVEGIHQAANTSAHGHYDDSKVAGGHEDSDKHKHK